MRVIATSHAGLMGESDFLLVIDESAPTTGGGVAIDWRGRGEAKSHAHLAGSVLCLPSSLDGFHVHWPGVYDRETLVSSCSIADTSAYEWSDVGAVLAVRLSVASVPANGTRAYSVRCCNPAGGCNVTEPSPQLARVSAPRGGAAMFEQAGNASAGYFSQASVLAGFWHGFATGSAFSQLSYESCIGTTAFGCQVEPFAAANESVGWRTDVSALPCGVTYHLTVRATNCAGLQHAVASDGAKLCCSGPDGGVVSVEDGSGEAVQYATTSTELSVRWASFVEPCSGVREYLVSLESADGAVVLWGVNASASDAVVALPPSVVSQLRHGETYRVRVIATSHAGLMGEVEAFVTLDESAPTAAVVRDGLGPLDATCRGGSLPHVCSWTLTYPSAAQPPIVHVEWALGTARFASDIRRFERLGPLTTSSQAPSTSKPGSMVFCTLRVTNAVNRSSIASSDGALILDTDTCAAPFACMPSPWSLLLMSAVATLPTASDPTFAGSRPNGVVDSAEHVYTVSTRVAVPAYGVHVFHTRLRLTDQPSAQESAREGAHDHAEARVFELAVESNTMVDRHGSTHILTGEYDMTRHPLHFRRGPDGTITDVFYHKDDGKRSVGTKRAYASLLQHRLFDPRAPLNTSARHEWRVRETDAVGSASAQYWLRGGHGFLRPRRVLYKRQRYHRSLAVPEGFSCESNSTSLIGADGVPTHITQSFHFWPTVRATLHGHASPTPPPLPG